MAAIRPFVFELFCFCSTGLSLLLFLHFGFCAVLLDMHLWLCAATKTAAGKIVITIFWTGEIVHDCDKTFCRITAWHM